MSAQRAKHKKRPKHWHRRDELRRWLASQRRWPATNVDVDSTAPELRPLKSKGQTNKGAAL